MIVWMIFGGKLLIRLKCQHSPLFSSMDATDRHRKAVVTLKIHNSGLDHLGSTHFLTLRHPYLGSDPYL